MIVRRRLRYEWWYAVHLLAYAGIALAWFHQIPTGNELVLDHGRGRLLARALRRHARAARRVPARSCRSCSALRYRLRVAEVVEEGPGVVSLRITGRDLDRLRARAGPVLPLALPRPRALVDGAPVLALGGAGRALAADHRQGARRPHRAARATSAPGTRVVAEGPFGAFTEAARRAREGRC